MKPDDPLNDDEEPGLEKNPGFLRDLGRFMLENKKWWLIPIVTVLLLMGVLIILAGTGAAPFIYTLF
jgi:hypothetical protein